MQIPTDEQWGLVKQILRYLKQTITFGLHLSGNTFLHLAEFSYADWAGSPDDRKSQGRHLIYLEPNLISW